MEKIHLPRLNGLELLHIYAHTNFLVNFSYKHLHGSNNCIINVSGRVIFTCTVVLNSGRAERNETTYGRATLVDRFPGNAVSPRAQEKLFTGHNYLRARGKTRSLFFLSLDGAEINR